MKRSTVMRCVGLIMYLAGYVAVAICVEESADAGEVVDRWLAIAGCAIVYLGGVVGESAE